MHRFGDQIELRVDRRHVLLFFLGAVFWTFVAFFFGMLVAGNGKTRQAERGLAALGWLDRHAQKQLEAQRKTVAFAFARRKPASRAVQVQPRPHVAGHGSQKPAAVAAKPAAAPPPARRALAVHRAPVHRRKPARRPVARPAAPAAIPPQPRPAQRPVAKRGKWTYRIAMRVPVKSRAFRLLKRFRRQGHAPIIAKLRLNSGGRTYRITFGRFATRATALSVAARLRRERIPGRIRVIRVR